MIRVLVVDDHPVLRAGLEAVLRSEPGFACVGAAADRDELLVLLRRTRPNVVVLDRRLGAADGLALCREIRSGALAPEVVIYTASNDTTEDDAARAGACGVIIKTRPVEDLFDAVRLAARRSVA
jgi:DNA-binding NarL/FixJ family response regulator